MYVVFKKSFQMRGSFIRSNDNITLSDEQFSKYAHPPLTDILLMVIFTLSLKAWVLIIMWFVLAPVAHRWDLGPLYVCLFSSLLFCLVFLGGGVVYSLYCPLCRHIAYWTMRFRALYYFIIIVTSVSLFMLTQLTIRPSLLNLSKI